MMITRRRLLKLAASSGFAALALMGYATGVEAMGMPRIRRISLAPPRWTPGLKLKVALLADFHACEPWMSAERIVGICEAVNALGADIVLLLGDFDTSMQVITGKVPHAMIAAALMRLQAPLGVHAILGNHDYWQDVAFQEDPSRKPRVQEALEAEGIPVYVNRAVRLEKDGFPFWLAGLGDQLAIRRFRPNGWPAISGIQDMEGTLAQVTDDAPLLMMAHEPYAFLDAPPRISLLLSGHTHGGQISFLGWAPFVSRVLDRRYLAGHMVEGERHLFVSRGLGCSLIPLRLGSWPEIVLMDLG